MDTQMDLYEYNNNYVHFNITREHGITMNYSMVILYGLQICGRSYTSMTF